MQTKNLNHPDLKKATRFLKNNTLDKAENLCTKVLEKDIQNTQAYNLLAQIMIAKGTPTVAKSLLETALQIAPQDADLYATAGHCLEQMQHGERAVIFYHKALEINPEHSFTHLCLGNHYATHALWDKSCLHYAKHILSVENENESPEVKQAFVNTLTNFRIGNAEMPQPLKKAITACLKDEQVQCINLAHNWLTIIRQEYITNEITIEHINEIEKNDLIRYGIEQLRPISAGFEQFIKTLRNLLLENIEMAPRQLLVALSMHCWQTEYVFSITEAENQILENLEKTITEQLQKNDTHNSDKLQNNILIYSCYKTLTSHPAIKNVERFIKQTKDSTLKHWQNKQINNANREQDIARSIAKPEKINNATSKSVQEQYEKNPYPRWNALPHIPAQNNEKLEILSAGCGTGQQVVHLTKIYPNSKITGIDLSTASLAYATRQIQDLNLNRNITLKHQDILSLEHSNKQYDHIMCTGVIHHMKEPEDGLKALKHCLKPEGTLRLALYSEAARQDIVAARSYISEHNIPATTDGIRAFRDQIHKLSQQKEQEHFSNSLIQRPDFYSLSECRDLVFHVQEHRYNITQILTMLENHNMKFVKFHIPRPIIRQTFFDKFGSGANLNDPLKWHELEQDYPTIFAGMYDFDVCHKS